MGLFLFAIKINSLIRGLQAINTHSRVRVCKNKLGTSFPLPPYPSISLSFSSMPASDSGPVK